ncbi:Cation/calcium exchanger 4-like protein [Drosera capensis]
MLQFDGFSLIKNPRRGVNQNPKFHRILNGFSVLVLCFFFYNRVGVLRNPILRDPNAVMGRKWDSRGGFYGGLGRGNGNRRRVVEISVNSSNSGDDLRVSDAPFCVGLIEHTGFSDRCEFLKAHPHCSSGGFFDYLKFMYCDFGNFPLLGYAVLGVWLVAVFYLILVTGEVSVGAAIAFVMIYVVYTIAVAANELLRKHAQRLKLDAVTPLLLVKGSVFSSQGSMEDDAMYSPLLDFESNSDTPRLHPTLPQWMWASNVAIYSNQLKNAADGERPPWGWTNEGVDSNKSFLYCSKLFSNLEFPLTVPRRLTIPLVEEETWSKPYADDMDSSSKAVACLVGSAIGCVLGVLRCRHTVLDHPPRRFLFPWVLGGFCMSIAWFYIIANELVVLLVGLGVMFGINPSILALTVLAWGNSVGDLVSNIALALNGGDGIQIAL